ncbi:MAG: hypothetical protein RI947_413 [Candidatus Parcubacteria bacterium]|jgi:hypothetical protein
MHVNKLFASFVVMPVTLLVINTGNAYVNTNSNVSINNGQVHSTVETHVESSDGSEASVTMQNRVESSSTSTTTIQKKTEVTVNGEKKVIESTTQSMSPTPTLKPSPTAVPLPSDDTEKMGSGIAESVQSFLKNLFSKLFDER